MKSFNIPGVFWVLLIAAAMWFLAGTDLVDPQIAVLLLTFLGLLAKSLQAYFVIPDEQMPELPDAPPGTLSSPMPATAEPQRRTVWQTTKYLLFQ